jgi:hypothetical protein
MFQVLRKLRNVQLFRKIESQLLQLSAKMSRTGELGFQGSMLPCATGENKSGYSGTRERGKDTQGRTMMFLLRLAFWLGVVLILLPSGGSKETSTRAPQGPTISATEAVSAASATVSDMSHFCSRQPDACAVGAQAAVVLGQRAQAGAKMVFDFLNERRSAQPAGSQPTGSISAGNSVRLGKPSQNTLTQPDVAPTWRLPPTPHKEAQVRSPI